MRRALAGTAVLAVLAGGCSGDDGAARPKASASAPKVDVDVPDGRELVAAAVEKLRAARTGRWTATARLTFPGEQGDVTMTQKVEGVFDRDRALHQLTVTQADTPSPVTYLHRGRDVLVRAGSAWQPADRTDLPMTLPTKAEGFAVPGIPELNAAATEGAPRVAPGRFALELLARPVVRLSPVEFELMLGVPSLDETAQLLDTPVSGEVVLTDTGELSQVAFGLTPYAHGLMRAADPPRSPGPTHSWIWSLNLSDVGAPVQIEAPPDA